MPLTLEDLDRLSRVETVIIEPSHWTNCSLDQFRELVAATRALRLLQGAGERALLARADAEIAGNPVRIYNATGQTWDCEECGTRTKPGGSHLCVAAQAAIRLAAREKDIERAVEAIDRAAACWSDANAAACLRAARQALKPLPEVPDAH